MIVSNIILLFAILFVVKCELKNSTGYCVSERSKSLVRKRRELIFPDGSNVVLTISLVKAYLTHAPAGWNLSLEIDVLFPLPDAKFAAEKNKKKLRHRQKREFWDRMRSALDYYHLNGYDCILRSICEANTYLAAPGKSLVHDILRALFTSPTHDDFANDTDEAYQEVLDPQFCEQANVCPFSLINYFLSLNKADY